MFSLPMSAVDEHVSSDSFFRSNRLHLSSRQIRDRLTKALSVIDGIVVIGDDPLATYALARTGTALDEIVVCQILVDQKPLTVLAVPKKVWFRTPSMERLLRAQRLFGKLDRKCVIIPHSAFAGLDKEDAANVLAAAIRSPDYPTCPQHVRHDPVGCLAHLLSTGVTCTG